MSRKSLERKIEESYQHIKPYLNKEDSCKDLHDMCAMCERFCGIEEHDYDECRHKACFINYLGFEYMKWVDSWE